MTYTFKSFMKRVLPIVTEMTNGKIEEMDVLRFKAEDLGYLFQLDFCSKLTPEQSAREFVEAYHGNRH